MVRLAGGRTCIGKYARWIGMGTPSSLFSSASSSSWDLHCQICAVDHHVKNEMTMLGNFPFFFPLEVDFKPWLMIAQKLSKFSSADAIQDLLPIQEISPVMTFLLVSKLGFKRCQRESKRRNKFQKYLRIHSSLFCSPHDKKI